MSGWPILSVVTFLPLVGAALILSIRGDDETALRSIRWAALWTTIVTFVLSLLIWLNFDQASPDMQFVERHEWLSGVASYHLGVDGISMLFVILTTFLMPICILASWHVSTRLREYMLA
ncbi:MAG: NADH-quinone oxidoreductase subunit M, partial [Rhizobiales bacterium]|nr:NADH-quinone oxidoreductase subunit M [Hyphomicrobiales bacterium]